MVQYADNSMVMMITTISITISCNRSRGYLSHEDIKKLMAKILH